MTTSLGTWGDVEHTCELRILDFDAPVTHVITVPHGTHTRLRKDHFRDAGGDTVAVGVLVSEMKRCPVADRFPAGRYFLLRRTYHTYYEDMESVYRERIYEEGK